MSDGVTTEAGRALLMSSDHPQGRRHTEENVEGRRSWTCVPLVDAMQAEWDAGAQAVEDERRRLYEAVADLRFKYARWPGDGADGEGPIADLLTDVLAILAPPAEKEQT